MPLFTLTTGLIAAAFLTVYGCISRCKGDDDDGTPDRPYHASTPRYGSITNQPTYQPPPSYAPAPPTSEISNLAQFPTRIISHHHSLERLPNAIILRSPPTYFRTQSSSSNDLQAPTRSGRCEAILNTPRSPLSDLSNVVSDEGEIIRGATTAEELRKRAQRMKHETQEARKRAQRARAKGDHDARVHESAMKYLNKEAARVLFKEKNKGHPEGTIDLHGLHVEEALDYAKQELQLATARVNNTVRFIVGKGLHAQDGKAKIRPALQQLCKERGLTHTLDSRNAGVLIRALHRNDTK
ncbi:hypothetical protein BJV74DRAFT_883189 [Russula compacta]|nr:hypothetical protein BJV74DRAFT_883189 [Russula compacta]